MPGSFELEKVKKEVLRRADMWDSVELEKVKTKVVSGKQTCGSLLRKVAALGK